MKPVGWIVLKGSGDARSLEKNIRTHTNQIRISGAADFAINLGINPFSISIKHAISINLIN